MTFNKRNLVTLKISDPDPILWCLGFDLDVYIKEEYVFISLYPLNAKYKHQDYDWVALESLHELN